jgi:hypothetical protein
MALYKFYSGARSTASGLSFAPSVYYYVSSNSTGHHVCLLVAIQFDNDLRSGSRKHFMWPLCSCIDITGLAHAHYLVPLELRASIGSTFNLHARCNSI